MKILITGSNGFIGKNCCEYFSKHHEITQYDITTHEKHPSVKDHDWIIHLGAISSTAETDVEKVLTLNLDYSIWLLNEALKHKVNIQWASSASVYGPECNDFIETNSVDPRSPYAWSKYLFERYVKNYYNNGIIIQGFRYFNVYGKYEDHKGDQASPYHKFKKQAKEENKIKLFNGSENYYRDFVPVEQVVSTHEKFFNVNESGIWNVGTGKTQSFTEIAQSFNVPIEYIDMPAAIQKSYQKYTCANMNKMNSTLYK